MAEPPAIYLASPLGFTPYGSAYARDLVTLVSDAGCIALDPWSSSAGEELTQLIRDGASVDQIAAANARVGAANAAMLDACDGVLACLDGVAVDDGTAAEIGFAAGIGRPIVAYRNDVRTTGDNVASVVNIQIEHFISTSGGEIFASCEEALTYLVELLC